MGISGHSCGVRHKYTGSMKRLTAYLTRLFLTDAVILFAVVCVLLWLVNCLRSFDVVAVKGRTSGPWRPKRC